MWDWWAVLRGLCEWRLLCKDTRYPLPRPSEASVCNLQDGESTLVALTVMSQAFCNPVTEGVSTNLETLSLLS